MLGCKGSSMSDMIFLSVSTNFWIHKCFLIGISQFCKFLTVLCINLCLFFPLVNLDWLVPKIINWELKIRIFRTANTNACIFLEKPLHCQINNFKSEWLIRNGSDPQPPLNKVAKMLVRSLGRHPWAPHYRPLLVNIDVWIICRVVWQQHIRDVVWHWLGIWIPCDQLCVVSSSHRSWLLLVMFSSTSLEIGSFNKCP